MSQEQSNTPPCESCERLAIENEQLRGAVTIWQKLADERKEQIAAQSERLVALSETAFKDAAPQVPEVRKAPGNPIVSSPAAAAPPDDKKGDGYEAELLARRFHELYERLAPRFGYVTRDDTRNFDLDTANAKLMTAVCAEMIAEARRCGSSLFAPSAVAASFVPWDLETVKQEIRDLFARYGSGDYTPSEEEKEIIENALDEILTPPPVAQSASAPRMVGGFCEDCERCLREIEALRRCLVDANGYSEEQVASMLKSASPDSRSAE